MQSLYQPRSGLVAEQNVYTPSSDMQKLAIIHLLTLLFAPYVPFAALSLTA
jgi:hypothetical protein